MFCGFLINTVDCSPSAMRATSSYSVDSGASLGRLGTSAAGPGALPTAGVRARLAPSSYWTTMLGSSCLFTMRCTVVNSGKSCRGRRLIFLCL